MKNNRRKIKVVSILVALFVFSNLSVVNAAGCYKNTTINGVNCTGTITKIYTINLNDYFSRYGKVIKVQPNVIVDNTEKPVGTVVPKTEAPKTEAPVDKNEQQKPSENNNTTTGKPVDQPSNNEQNSNLNDVSAVEKEVVRLVNVERQKNGLNPLELDAELSKVARLKSQDMATKGYFSHTSPTYGSPFDMMKQFGIKYSAAGENIAMGQPTAEAVVKAWMNSEGHRANILSKSFTKIGVGYYKGNNGSPYWTQMFIKPY